MWKVINITFPLFVWFGLYLTFPTVATPLFAGLFGFEVLTTAVLKTAGYRVKMVKWE